MAPAAGFVLFRAFARAGHCAESSPWKFTEDSLQYVDTVLLLLEVGKLRPRAVRHQRHMAYQWLSLQRPAHHHSGTRPRTNTLTATPAVTKCLVSTVLRPRSSLGPITIPHWTREEVAQRGRVASPRSHSCWEAELGFEPEREAMGSVLLAPPPLAVPRGSWRCGSQRCPMASPISTPSPASPAELLLSTSAPPGWLGE